MSVSQLVDQLRVRGWRGYRDASALIVVLLGIALLGLWLVLPGSRIAPSEPETLAQPVAASSTTFSVHAAPRQVPDVEFEDAAGAKRHLADWRGRVVVLNLWATWCVPCRTEMPTLDGLQSRLGSKDFEVVALSIDRDGVPIVKRFFDDTKVRALAIYVDPTMEAQGKLGAVGVPMTLLIDREGREVARKLGPAAWDAPEVIAVIQKYLPRSGP